MMVHGRSYIKYEKRKKKREESDISKKYIEKKRFNLSDQRKRDRQRVYMVTETGIVGRIFLIDLILNLLLCSSNESSNFTILYLFLKDIKP